eukprot:121626_1
MALQLCEQTEGLDLKTLLRKYDLEELLPKLEKNKLSLEVLTNATESNLREISNILECNIVTELRFITAIKSIPNAAANLAKDFVFLGTEEKAILDGLHDQHKKLSHDIHQIQNAINSLERNAVECDKTIHAKCDQILSVVEKYRKSLLEKAKTTKTEKKSELEIHLNKLKQLNKNVNKAMRECQQTAIDNNKSSIRIEQMRKIIDQCNHEEFKLNVKKIGSVPTALEVKWDLNLIRSGLNAGLNTQVTEQKIDAQFEPYTEFDEFDSQCISKRMKYDSGTFSVVQLQDKCYASAYLKNVVEKGIHHWTFEICKITHSGQSTMSIGIWKVQQENPALNTFFTEGNNKGYAFCPEKAQLIDTTNGGVNSGSSKTAYGQVCKSGAIVEMTLDFNELSLSYVINGKNYGKAYNIIQAKYRAAVFL